jgi:hypothetical protein
MANSLRASLIELFTRKIVTTKSDIVYINDEDNLYPNRIEAIINNSPTASRCAKLMEKFISGQGFEDAAQDIIINKAKNYRLSDIKNLAAKSLSVHYGVYFQIFYGIDFKINKIDILPNIKCRNSKEDASENKGKIYFKDWTEKNKYGSKDKPQTFYPYNPKKDVILAQMKADSPKATTMEELVAGSTGQVYYLNLTPEFHYSLSLVDCVYNDADTEYRLSLYVNKQMRTGFLDQTIIITQGIGEELDNKINKQLQELMGAESTGNLMHLTVPQGTDIELDKALVTKQIPSSFKPELLDKIVGHLRKNILGAFNNIPEALVSAGDGTLFGTNSETYSQMKDFYSEQTAFERQSIEKTLKMFGFDIKIKAIKSEKATNLDENIKLKLKAQAELKGSVGGITALVTLAQSVSQKTLDLESAVQIVINIYGFDEATARAMIGTPTITQQPI